MAQKTDKWDAAVAVELAKQHSAKAVRKLIALMDCDSPKVALAACNAILDRAYGRPSQSVAVSGTVKHTLEEIITGSYLQTEANDNSSASQRSH